MTKTRGSAIAAVLVLAASIVPFGRGSALAAPPPAMSASEIATMFGSYGDAGGHWTGGDSTASVLLPDGRVVWLFSDTFLGTVNSDGSRPAGTPMINNTIVVQSGTNLVSTLHGGTATSPTAYVPANASDEQLWVGDGLIEGGSLKVLYGRYKRVGSGGLDVELRGTSLVTFSLPSLAIASVVDLPLGDDIAWGSAVLEDGGYTYIYGSSYVHADSMKFGHVARVPSGSLASAWQFWTGSGWSSSESAAARMLSGVGTAYAVQKVGGQYVLVTQESNIAFNSQFVAYTASSPVGPFSGPVQLFTAPEPQPGTEIIVYDSRLHPELARPGKLLISYNVNSLHNADNFADARLYRPRFVEVDWPLPVPDPSTLPAAPAGFAATADETGTAHLTWQAVPGAQSYRVYRRDVTAGQTHVARLPNSVDGTSTDVGMLISGHTYEFSVAAVNANGEGPRSAVAAVTAQIAPPPAPTGITASANTSGRITVAWTALANVWRYDVYRRDITAGETEFSYVTAKGGGEDHLDMDWLDNGHEYEMYVTASHGGGTSPPSAAVRATAHYAPPGAPAGLTATGNADGTISLQWTAPGPDVWYWVYQRDITAGETEFTQLPLPVTTCCTFTAGYLAHEHEYEFKVSAINRGGESPGSNTARATARYPSPVAPANLRATAGDGQVTLVWDSAGSDVWYWVYQRDATAGETEFTRLPLPVSSCCTITPGYLTNGHTYEYKVTALNAAGEGPASAVVSVVPMAPLPGQVTGLTATGQTDGSIRLEWTGVGENVWYFIELRDLNGSGQWQRLPLPVTTCCTMTAGYLTNGHTYQFRVVAVNATGEGPASAIAQATSVYSPPPAPANLRGGSAGDGTIDLNWDAPAPGLYYWVYYRDVTAGQTGFTRTTYPTDKTWASLGLLVHGHTYEFKVSAENPGGEGPASASIQVTSYGGLPGAPSGLTATAGNGSVTLNWSASPTPNVYYIVYQRDVTAGQSWQKLPLPITSCCTMTAGYLTNGHTYEFKVAATNAAGDSAASNVASARPMPPLPQAPSGLTATPGDGKVTLRWSASPTPDVYYWVEMRANGGSWQRLRYPVSSCCTLTVSYLTNGTTYEFRVKATNLSGDSTPSNVASARPMPPFPQAPSGLTATPGDGQVTLKWSASPTPNVWYWVEQRSSGGSWQRLPLPVTSCCTFVGGYLTNGTTYEFRVRATNLSGDSAPSNVASARPMPPVPKAPTWLSAVSPQGSQATVNLSWGASPTPNVWYWLYYRNASAGQTGWIRTVYPITSTSIALRDAFVNGDVYEFQVSAFNLSGEARLSSTDDAVPRRYKPVWFWPRAMNVANGSNDKAGLWALGRGLSCQPDFQQFVCFGPPPSLTGQPITVGDFFFYPGSATELENELVSEAYTRLSLRRSYGAWAQANRGPDVLRHEAIHSGQWAWHVSWLSFASAYGAASAYSEWKTGNPACENYFEKDANLWWGGYKRYPSGGPCG